MTAVSLAAALSVPLRITPGRSCRPPRRRSFLFRNNALLFNGLGTVNGMVGLPPYSACRTQYGEWGNDQTGYAECRRRLGRDADRCGCASAPPAGGEAREDWKRKRLHSIH